MKKLTKQTAEEATEQRFEAWQDLANQFYRGGLTHGGLRDTRRAVKALGFGEHLPAILAALGYADERGCLYPKWIRKGKA